MNRDQILKEPKRILIPISTKCKRFIGHFEEDKSNTHIIQTLLFIPLSLFLFSFLFFFFVQDMSFKSHHVGPKTYLYKLVAVGLHPSPITFLGLGFLPHTIIYNL